MNIKDRKAFWMILAIAAVIALGVAFFAGSQEAATGPPPAGVALVRTMVAGQGITSEPVALEAGKMYSADCPSYAAGCELQLGNGTGFEEHLRIVREGATDWRTLPANVVTAVSLQAGESANYCVRCEPVSWVPPGEFRVDLVGFFISTSEASTAAAPCHAVIMTPPQRE